MKLSQMKLLVGLMIIMVVFSACTAATTGDSMESGDMHSEETMMTDDKDMADEDMADMKDMNEDMDKVGDDAMESEEMESMDKDMEEEMMTNEGPMAPDFELTDLDGNVYRLSDLKGEKVYMKYWASWCSICLSGLGEVDALFESDPDFKMFTVVTPGANGEKSVEDFTKWFKSLEYENIVVLLDVDGVLAKELNVRAFPTSVFIGSDGVLIQSLPGHKSNDVIFEKIESFH